MKHDPKFYGDAVADMYDTLCSRSDWLDPTDAVELLARLAGAGRALELGVGTGRIALPLQARGVEVVGVDASRRMVEQLRSKPGGDRLTIVVGDFADVAMPGPFSLVYIAFNTLFHLADQERQIACLRNVADRLSPGGALVVECFVPTPPAPGVNGGQLTVWNVTDDSVDIGVRWYDVRDQSYVEQHVYLEDGTVRLNHNRGREVSPAELDLMARLAGLRLRERWGGWRCEPFTTLSRSHVSAYEPIA